MKILYVGPYCFGMEDSLVGAFRNAGAEVFPLIYDRPSAGGGAAKWKRVIKSTLPVKKIMGSFGLLNVYLNRQWTPFNHEILSLYRQENPDIVFIVKGEVVFPSTLEIMKKKSTLVSYQWDDPFLTHVRKQDGTNDIRFSNMEASYALYDHTFVYDQYYVGPLKEKGAPRVTFLSHWFEADIFKKMNLSPEEEKKWGADVAFVGAPYPNRVALLERLQSFHVGVWGPAWRWKKLFSKHPFLKDQFRGEADGWAAAKIYNASKVALNIHDDFQIRDGINNRTFQICAAGAFQLVDTKPALQDYFKPGRDLETFTSPDEAMDKISYFLTHGDERAAIAARGHQAAQPHSVDHRVRFILETVKTNTVKT